MLFLLGIALYQGLRSLWSVLFGPYVPLSAPDVIILLGNYDGLIWAIHFRKGLWHSRRLLRAYAVYGAKAVHKLFAVNSHYSFSWKCFLNYI